MNFSRVFFFWNELTLVALHIVILQVFDVESVCSRVLNAVALLRRYVVNQTTHLSW